MGSALNQIVNGGKSVVGGVAGGARSLIGGVSQGANQFVSSAMNGNLGAKANYSQPKSGKFFNYATHSWIDTTPPPPVPKTAAELAQEAQLSDAKKFRADLPETKSLFSQNLSQSANQQLSGDLDQVTNQNNKRGLLYGGVNEGQKGQVTAGAQQNLAKSISQSNQSLEQQANTLETQAVSSGLSIQQQKQQIYNDVYAQAQARQSANNSMFGQAASTALLYALL